jgi:hypothetical protein
MEVLVLSGPEFWSAVIALLFVPLAYLLRTLVDEGEQEDARPWRWGDRRRRPPHEATWGRYEYLLALMGLTVLATLKVVL